MRLTLADIMKCGGLAAAAGLALLPATAQAAPITYQYSGIVDGSFGANVPQGTAFTGTLKIDPEMGQAATGADGSKFGTYGSPIGSEIVSPSGPSASVDFGGLRSYTTADPIARTVSIQNGGPSALATRDELGTVVSDPATDPFSPSYDPTQLAADAFQVDIRESSGSVFQLNLTDINGKAFSGTGLPTDLSLGQFQAAYIVFTTPDGAGQIRGRITDLSSLGPDPQPVPEPATLAVLGLGVAGLALARRRRAAR